MQSNTQSLNTKKYLATQVLKRNVVSTSMLFSFLLMIGVVWSLPKAYAADKAVDQGNLFEEKYYEQNDRHLKSLIASPETVLELGENQEADNTRMLENGYDMMGTSEFVSPKISSELARTYGKKIKADVVLVYDRPTSLTTNMVNFDGTEEGNKTMKEANEANARNMQTIHSASYWAKMPMPLLGVHIIKLVKTASNQNEPGIVQQGLKIIAVIKDSPAAKANIATGDTLLKIGEIELAKADDLFEAVKRYQGQTVEVEFRHDDVNLKTTVALNSRK